MKFIKTYWPDLAGIDDATYYLKVQREPLYLFTLSSLTIIEHNDLELYTDADGEKIIRELEIPFKKINIVSRKSKRYKSVNDLYVISLQNEPVTFIEDNLLSFSKLTIPHSQSSVYVLGIELNSVKLVKSLIKFKRLNVGAELVDDTLWKEKMGYVDTSLLSLTNSNDIKSYLSEVFQFIASNESGLSKIENSLVDLFFARYWLYSFLKVRQYDFTTYFDDPLEVILPRDNFAFSNYNKVQNIIKLTDHHISTAEFGIHLYQFFNLHYPGYYQRIEALSKGPKSKKRNNTSYIRSLESLKKIHHNNEVLIKDIVSDKKVPLRLLKKTISDLKSDLVHAKDGEMVADVLEFETYLSKVNAFFKKNTPLIFEQQQRNFDKLLKNWDLPPQSMANLLIEVNPYAFLSESAWKWCTSWVTGVDPALVAKLKVTYNRHVTPGYHVTAFLPNLETNITHEFNLDKTTAEIITFFMEKHSMDDYFNLPHFKNDAESAHETTYLNDPVKYRHFYKILDLLKINLICFI
jgi:hypothetical protein